jgi:acetolactate synthase I/II/III large subunit
MKINGAQILIKSLEEQEVEVVFGYPGGAVLEIYDAFRDSSIRHILVRHEQGGAHAASGYARALGKVGVVLGTSGPGATNLVTGIATAYMDSVPLVIITGQVPKRLVGTDAFQEVDTTGITAPITKHNYFVQDVNDLPRIVAEAFYIAKSGRPGPVLIDIPRDISMAMSTYKPHKEVDIRSYKPTLLGHPAMIKKAAELLRKSKDLVICTGGGVINADASEEVLELQKITNSQVVATMMGLGAFPGSHESFKGMLGTYGTRSANEAIQNCDCLLALGMRFDNRVVGNPEKFAPNAKIIHIDIDPAEIGKNMKAQLPIVGDLKYILKEILKNMETVETRDDESKEYEEISNIPERLSAPWILEKVQEMIPRDAIVTTDVGQHQVWTALHYSFQTPRSFISSGGLGTMGYGIPAALGAQVAMPENLVLAVTGDGSFQMGMSELGTIAELGLPVKILIFNNQALGMVRQLQYHYTEKRYTAVDFKKTLDFITLAKAYGAKGYRIESTENAREILREAFSNDEFCIIECPIEADDLVSPIVLAGKGLDEMLEF